MIEAKTARSEEFCLILTTFHLCSVSHQTTAAATVSGETTKQPSGPKLLPGGLWESSEKTPLKDEQYIPIQPLLRKERKETDHCKVKLFKWLEREEKIERCWLSLEGGKEVRSHEERT